jgi:hypothetical protein
MQAQCQIAQKMAVSRKLFHLLEKKEVGTAEKESLIWSLAPRCSEGYPPGFVQTSGRAAIIQPRTWLSTPRASVVLRNLQKTNQVIASPQTLEVSRVKLRDALTFQIAALSLWIGLLTWAGGLQPLAIK